MGGHRFARNSMVHKRHQKREDPSPEALVLIVTFEWSKELLSSKIEFDNHILACP